MIHWRSQLLCTEDSLCKILKVYDNECAENLILILSLEMEDIFNLSKHLAVIWTFLKILKLYCYNGSENEIGEDDTIF